MIAEQLDQVKRPVHDARADELSALYAALARAFTDDPVTEFLFPSARSRVRRLEAFYRWMIPSLAAEGLMHTDDDVRGGAIWQAPRPPRPGASQLFSSMLRSAFVLRGRLLAGMALARALEAVHESKPHWYLAILGTDPHYQGKGIGSALIAPVLEHCDRAG